MMLGKIYFAFKIFVGFFSGKTFFRGRGYKLAVFYETGGRVMVKTGYSQNICRRIHLKLKFCRSRIDWLCAFYPIRIRILFFCNKAGDCFCGFYREKSSKIKNRKNDKSVDSADEMKQFFNIVPCVKAKSLHICRYRKKI